MTIFRVTFDEAPESGGSAGVALRAVAGYLDATDAVYRYERPDGTALGDVEGDVQAALLSVAHTGSYRVEELPGEG